MWTPRNGVGMICSDSSDCSVITNVSVCSLLMGGRSISRLGVFLVRGNVSRRGGSGFAAVYRGFGHRVAFVPVSSVRGLAGSSVGVKE